MNEYSNGLELIEDLFNKRWIPEILHSISLGNKHYKDILESIDYISHTELNRKIKLLLDYNVLKKDEKEKTYQMTDFGFDINHIFGHIYEISDKYLSHSNL